MIRFNPWLSYPWENGKYSQNERATLEDNYKDEACMYSLMGKLLEALSDRLLEVERNGTIYDIPICNIKSIYLTCDDCDIKLIKNGHFYESELDEGGMKVRTAESIEVKRPKFKII